MDYKKVTVEHVAAALEVSGPDGMMAADFFHQQYRRQWPELLKSGVRLSILTNTAKVQDYIRIIGVQTPDNMNKPRTLGFCKHCGSVVPVGVTKKIEVCKRYECKLEEASRLKRATRASQKAGEDSGSADAA